LVHGSAVLVDGLVVVASLVGNAMLGSIDPHGQIITALINARSTSQTTTTTTTNNKYSTQSV
jgi:hypothetical protein